MNHRNRRPANKRLVIIGGGFLAIVWLASHWNEWKGVIGHG